MKAHPIKQHLVQIPLLGYGLRVVNDVLRSPLHRDEALKKNEELFRATLDNQHNLVAVTSSLEHLEERMKVLLKNQDSLQKQFTLLEKHDQLVANSTSGANNATRSELFAEDHLLDLFYTDFEDRFKNSEETARLLKIYEKDFTKSELNFKKYPVVDIGCGRGEFLEYMKKLKINALGVDINTDMVERAKKIGLNVTQGDALSYLQGVEPQSLGAVTGFHIVEHIPFQALLRIFSAAYTSLVTDGFVLFETPNPENIAVATNSFYFDPSHLKPLPPELLAFALEVTGFRNVEIRRSYPVKTDNDEGLNADLFRMLYGPRNYAVIGYK